jgi:hypothetical protein
MRAFANVLCENNNDVTKVSGCSENDSEVLDWANRREEGVEGDMWID